MNSNKKTSPLFSELSRVLSRPAMRPVVRVFTNLHALLYRLSGGRAQSGKYPTMLLTTAGRKTGQPRTVPLIYLADGDRFVVAAAYSGSPKHPTWWLNLQQSKEAIVTVMRTAVRVRAELASPEERERYWPRLVNMYPYFTEYQQRTQRQIPIVVLTPEVDETPVNSGTPERNRELCSAGNGSV
jgi:F420H(2)-dependent quinone reductase